MPFRGYCETQRYPTVSWQQAPEPIKPQTIIATIDILETDLLCIERAPLTSCRTRLAAGDLEDSGDQIVGPLNPSSMFYCCLVLVHRLFLKSFTPPVHQPGHSRTHVLMASFSGGV
jgi:hypothetical protein